MLMKIKNKKYFMETINALHLFIKIIFYEIIPHAHSPQNDDVTYMHQFTSNECNSASAYVLSRWYRV